MPLPKPPTRLVALDTETTGLDPERHVMFDVAMITVDENNKPPRQPTKHRSTYQPTIESDEREYKRWKEINDAWDWRSEEAYWLEPGYALEHADSTALRLNGYYKRAAAFRAKTKPRGYRVCSHTEDPRRIAGLMADALDGAHIVGFNPSFDVRFMENFLRRNGYAPTWHYHLIDVEMLMLATLAKQPPFKSDDLVRLLDVEIPKDRHTAMADARLALDCYDVCYKINRKRVQDEVRAQHKEDIRGNSD